MAKIIPLKPFDDERGLLTVLDKEIPFNIKRVFYIHGKEGYKRGGHRHHKSMQALICVNGSCSIYNHDGGKEEDFLLDNPQKCLLLDPQDWHIMHKFSKDSILLVLASTHYDINDYIDEPY